MSADSACSTPDCRMNQNERYTAQQEWNREMNIKFADMAEKVDGLGRRIAIIVGIGIGIQSILIVAVKLIR